MKPMFAIAKKAPPELKRIVYAEGEEERVLRAVQVVVDEKLARPILVGRPAVLEQRIEKFGLRLKPGVRLRRHQSRIRRALPRLLANLLLTMTMRKGVTAGMRQAGDAPPPYADRRDDDPQGRRRRHDLRHLSAPPTLHLHYIDQVLGKRAGANVYAAMNVLILPDRQVVMVDTHVNENPTAEQMAEITMLAAEEMRRFGIAPRVALLSHSNFGTSQQRVGAEDARRAGAGARTGAGPGSRRRDAWRRRARRRKLLQAHHARHRRSTATPTCW